MEPRLAIKYFRTAKRTIILIMRQKVLIKNKIKTIILSLVVKLSKKLEMN